MIYPIVVVFVLTVILIIVLLVMGCKLRKLLYSSSLEDRRKARNFIVNLKCCNENDKMDERILNYCMALTNSLKSIHSQVGASQEEESEDQCHVYKPGDCVMVKSFHRKNCLDPRWCGPYQVLLTTKTAVKLQGKPTWIHATQLRRAPDPDGRNSETT